MGKSRLSRKKRRALAARDQKPEQDPNKFVLPPRESKRDSQGPAAGGVNNQRFPGAGITKRKRKDRRADKVKDRIRGILTDPGISKVIVAWDSGGEKTFNFGSGSGSGTADGETADGEKKQEGGTQLPNGEQRQACSASGTPPKGDPTYGREPRMEPELTEARTTTPDPPPETTIPFGSSPMRPDLAEGRNTTPDRPGSIVLGSSSPTQETQIIHHVSPQLTPRRTRRNLLLEVANSQASEDEDSFHDSQEYLSPDDREEAAYVTRRMQTTPEARRERSDSPVLGPSPVLDPMSGDEVDGEGPGDMSLPPPVQSSPQLPRLLATEPEPAGTKRAHDPYEIIPTPPKKRVLRSSGKPFAMPPWKTSPIRASGSATHTTKARRGSGLLRGKSVVSQAELLSVFSDPDPEFDRLGGGVPGANMAPPATNGRAAAEKEIPVSPPNRSVDEGRKDSTDMPPPARNEGRDKSTPMSPRRRAVREWKGDNGELSDGTSYTGVMSTSLRNYGRTPGTSSPQRPGPRHSTRKPTTPKGSGAAMKARRSSSGGRCVASKKALARMAELPTSSTADSVAGSPGSSVPTKATTPADEVAPKPAVALKPVVTPKPVATPKTWSKPQGGSILPKPPSLTKGRQGGSMLPKIPSLTKRRSSKSSGPSSSVKSSPMPKVAGPHTSTGPKAKNTRSRVEVVIPAPTNQAAQVSESSQAKQQAEEPRPEAKATSKKTGTSKKTETEEKTEEKAPRRRSLRISELLE